MDFFGYAAGTPWTWLEWTVFILFVITTLEIIFILPATASKTWRKIFWNKKHNKKHNKKNIEKEEDKDQD